MTILDGKKIFIINSEFSSTNGTAPQAGIDIEPDSAVNAYTCEDITVSNCTFKSNVGNGVVAAGSLAVINNLTVINC